MNDHADAADAAFFAVGSAPAQLAATLATRRE
jgi:hypothetical protein